MSSDDFKTTNDEQNRTDQPTPLNRWWIILFCTALIIGFATLITITCRGYTDKPPIPDEVCDIRGNVLFSGKDIREGQIVFLNNGLMSNGSVWGHGSYLGPDFPALTLHRMAKQAQDAFAEENYGKSYGQLSVDQKGDVDSQVERAIKENRFDTASGQLTLLPFQVKAYQDEPELWREYFNNPAKNGGLKKATITDPQELKQLSAYFTWMAWASSAKRPGETYSYTNNFPYDPLVGNRPTAVALVYSAASILFLLGAIGLTLYFIGSHPEWDWHSPSSALTPMTPTSMTSPSQKALVKFVVFVAFILLMQTLVGGGVAHLRADPTNFYGINLSEYFPSSLLRTFHLQAMIFWLATGFVTGGLFLSRVLGGKEQKYEPQLINILFAAFAVVVFGSILCEWGGLSGLWDGLNFWLGSQGWEYLEIGRLWQWLLIIGLLFWFFLVWRNTRPALAVPSKKKLAIMFLVAAFSIPFFYLPAVFFNDMTHYTVVDTWRFWIIHLWVEGFFELFATTMVALTFIELGLVSKQMGLRLIFLDGILIFMGGIIGTGHHWYFSGMSSTNMMLSSCFSAMEVVPLVILCGEAWSFKKTALLGPNEAVIHKFYWPLMFMFGVGFWNFVGAGVLGFLINMPIVSYFEVGTYLTPNHGHASMFGVFGMLSLALCLLVLRQSCNDEVWAKNEKWIKCSFWGFNIGLFLMLVCSLMPGGFLQLWDVVTNGYWHARSSEFTNSGIMSFLGYFRMPGDLVFIFLGAIPFFIASVRIWLENRRHA